VFATWVPSFLFSCGGHETKICGGSQIYIIFSLVYILARGCLLSAYSKQNRCCYWGSEFLIYLWRSRNQNLRWVTDLYYYLLSGLHSSPRVSIFCLKYTHRCWLLGFRVSYLFVVVMKPKSAVGHKSRSSSLLFTDSGPRVSTVCLQYTEQVFATGVPSFLLFVVVTKPKIGEVNKSILSSLWFTFWPEGVYCLLTVYRTGVGYWGSEFLIYLWWSRNQNLFLKTKWCVNKN
jgi:hypothetical protein